MDNLEKKIQKTIRKVFNVSIWTRISVKIHSKSDHIIIQINNDEYHFQDKYLNLLK